jgi:hypothetical protein
MYSRPKSSLEGESEMPAGISLFLCSGWTKAREVPREMRKRGPILDIF